VSSDGLDGWSRQVDSEAPSTISILLETERSLVRIELGFLDTKRVGESWRSNRRGLLSLVSIHRVLQVLVNLLSSWHFLSLLFFVSLPDVSASALVAAQKVITAVVSDVISVTIGVV